MRRCAVFAIVALDLADLNHLDGLEAQSLRENWQLFTLRDDYETTMVVLRVLGWGFSGGGWRSKNVVNCGR